MNFKDKLILLLVLIVSSGSSPFVSGIYSIITLFFIVIILKGKNIFLGNKIRKGFLYLLLVIFIYTIGIAIIFQRNIEFTMVARYVFLFLISGFIINAYKENLMKYLEKIIYSLVFISLIFFIFQLFFFNWIYSIEKYFFEMLPVEKGIYISQRNYYASILIHTINQQSSSLAEQRNCGFVYEPGYFSLFINIGLMIELIKMGFKNKIKILVYLLATISTFSTTALIGFILVLSIYFANLKLTSKLFFLPLILLIVIAFYNLSFGYEKIKTILSERKEIHEYQEYAKYGSVSMGRFTGLEYYLTLVLEKSPIFGVTLIGWKEQENVGVSNGIAHFVRNFGFLGLLLVIYSIYKSSRKISVSNLLMSKNHYLLFLFFITYLFAFPFSNLLIFWIFALYYLFYEFKNVNLNIK